MRTGAELKTLREALGLSHRAPGELLDRPVAPCTVRSWESGGSAVPDDVAATLRRLDALVDRSADQA